MRSTGRTDEEPDAGRALRRAPLSIIVFKCAGSPTQGGQSEVAMERDPFPGAPSAPIHEISVPCSGRLQPEHFLKAFEAGADLVLVLTCHDGDCLYLEGRRRVQLRVDYVRGLLDEVGLSGERLLMVESPAGSSSKKGPAQQPDGIHEALAAALVGLAPNPLHGGSDERAD